METVILDADAKENIKLCADIIKNGGLVAIPTETVYGLAANAMDKTAVAKIFNIKGRQQDNPLIVHIESVDDVKKYATQVPNIFHTLAEHFWPGPLTLIMKKGEGISETVTAGLETIAIRMPNHPATLALIRESGYPIAAPSANLSGSPSPTKATHVRDDIGGKIPYILDGGDCDVGLESTVLDITGDIPYILRPGAVTEDELSKIIGSIETARSFSSETPRSPGMKYRHYAPKAPMTAVIGEPEYTKSFIKSKLDDVTGALMFDDFEISHPNVVTFGNSDNLEEQANRLFDALRKFDNMSVKEIYAQIPKEEGLGLAIANRIKKAAANTVVVRSCL